MPTKTKETNKEKNTTKNKTNTVASKVKSNKKTTTTKKSSVVKRAASNAKNTAAKKASTLKKTASAPKSAATKKTSTKKSSTTRKTTVSKGTTNKKSTRKAKPVAEVVEYYDLPYRYNETIVKILYQTPDTLFVYWDISDKDREKYIKEYGQNFFSITRPVLIIHNTTMNYSFEIPINDFANSWYLHINDSKCDYRVELGRRPNYYNEEAAKEIQENIHTDYIYVSNSNEIETPNDHVLFSTNENNTVKFKNIKSHEEKSVSLSDIIKKLPAMKDSSNVPYISESLLKNLYSSIYQNEDITFFDRISNPSSGNPSSGSMPTSKV